MKSSFHEPVGAIAHTPLTSAPSRLLVKSTRALPTNIGRYSRTAFAVVPEAALNVGYRITPAVTLVLGGSLLYANNVVRPGKQLSRTINSTQTTAYTENPTAPLIGPALPTFQFNHSAFWTQGVSLGFTLRF